MAHLATKLPWDALLQFLLVNPVYTSDKYKHQMERVLCTFEREQPLVLNLEKLDRNRLAYFVEKFIEQITEFAKTERAKYPDKNELRKKYSKLTRKDLPIIDCTCGAHRYPENDYYDLGDSQEKSEYLQHVMQEENVTELLRIATVDPKFYRACNYGKFGDCGGYGLSLENMYLKLYIYLNILATADQSIFKQRPDLYKCLLRECYSHRDSEPVIPHKIYQLLQSNTYFEDETKNKEILRLTFKQLYLFQMIHIEVGFESNWEKMIADILSCAGRRYNLFECSECYETSIKPHPKPCTEK